MSCMTGAGERLDSPRIAEHKRMLEIERIKLVRPFGGGPLQPGKAWTWDAGAQTWRDLEGNVCEGPGIARAGR